MRTRIFFGSSTSALAGFIFGFDTAVISGAEQKLQSICNLSPGLHRMAIAAVRSRIVENARPWMQKLLKLEEPVEEAPAAVAR